MHSIHYQPKAAWDGSLIFG